MGMLSLLAFAGVSLGAVVNYETAGAKPFDQSNATQWANGDLLNRTLAGLKPGDVFVVPNKTFHLMGGVRAGPLSSVTFRIDGTLSFFDSIKEWPRRTGGQVLDCLSFERLTNCTFTSSGIGTLEGNGQSWWGIPFIGYLERQENRPMLLVLDEPKDVVVENLFFHNSPYWTFLANTGNGIEIRNCHIDARRDNVDGHDLLDISAFNTDGFDFDHGCKNVWVHDCTVWNQDDSVCVKDGGENFLIERVNASGIGLTIGSIGGTTVRNITFRDCYMHHSYKGIYMKFRDEPNSVIENVLYENIVMDSPSQWPIWIGPAQQSDSDNLCAARPCSLCWPELPFAECNAPSSGSYRNITLRNILINSPKKSPGVILASPANPMQNVVFDNVRVTNPGTKPWGDAFYKCENVNGIAIGGTDPVPPCFRNMTSD
eukprot:Hpha_TRINITY_DN16453_c1_g13::TRINITY_DN16453_c1_g13_i1::g.161247::m.161247